MSDYRRGGRGRPSGDPEPTRIMPGGDGPGRRHDPRYEPDDRFGTGRGAGDDGGSGGNGDRDYRDRHGGYDDQDRRGYGGYTPDRGDGYGDDDADESAYYSRTYSGARLRRAGDGRDQRGDGRGPAGPRPPRPGRSTGYPAGKRKRPVRRVLAVVLVLVLLYVGAYVGIAIASYGKLNRVDVLTDYAGRPAATPGEDWLLVGSDSRTGLTRKQQNAYHTGHTGGQRADSMMLLHIPAFGGQATMVSLPRDSYVSIPGHGKNKINAAYAFGGGKLLVRTVEGATGIRIDHYMEIGFGGFASTVDALGGVRICVKQGGYDSVQKVRFKTGCQTMKGGKALMYVRSRHAFATGDFARADHQRQFLAALMKKMASPPVLLNPFRFGPVALTTASGITVDRSTGLIDLGRLFLTMKGKNRSMTVPVNGGAVVPGAGDVVLWDKAKATKLFDQLQKDEKVTVK